MYWATKSSMFHSEEDSERCANIMHQQKNVDVEFVTSAPLQVNDRV